MSLVRRIGEHSLLSDGRVEGIDAHSVVDIAVSSAPLLALHGEDGSCAVYAGPRWTLVATRARVVSVACASRSTAVAMEDGTVYVLGKQWTHVPLDARAVLVRAGADAYAAITDVGELYTWGNNSNLILGRALDTTPLALALPAVADVGFGLDFAVALGKSGKLFLWGMGNAPRAVYSDFRFVLLAVGKRFFSAVFPTFRCLLSAAPHPVVRMNVRVTHVYETMRAITATWSSDRLFTEYTKGTSGPARPRPLIALRTYRIARRINAVMCVLREQKKKLRSRPRACQDGEWTGKLPMELWRMIIMYL